MDPDAATWAASGSGPAAAPVADRWGTLVAVERDGSEGRRFALAGEWVVVGRGDADIVLDDRYLARQHARFELRDGTPTIVPIDTLNGVFVRAARPAVLRDGAVLLLGREVVRFELVDEQERRAPELVRHGVTLFGSPVRDAWGRLVQLVPTGSARDVRHLVGDEVVIGREEGDVMFPDDEFLSRRHAALSFQAGRCTVTDLGSSNGTFIRARGPTVLGTGEHVRIGDQMFRLDPPER